MYFHKNSIYVFDLTLSNREKQSTTRHCTLHTHNIDTLPHRRTYKSLNS